MVHLTMTRKAYNALFGHKISSFSNRAERRQFAKRMGEPMLKGYNRPIKNYEK